MDANVLWEHVNEKHKYQEVFPELLPGEQRKGKCEEQAWRSQAPWVAGGPCRAAPSFTGLCPLLLVTRTAHTSWEARSRQVLGLGLGPPCPH